MIFDTVAFIDRNKDKILGKFVLSGDDVQELGSIHASGVAKISLYFPDSMSCRSAGSSFLVSSVIPQAAIPRARYDLTSLSANFCPGTQYLIIYQCLGRCNNK